jgi:hypothetical protein
MRRRVMTAAPGPEDEHQVETRKRKRACTLPRQSTSALLAEHTGVLVVSSRPGLRQAGRR